MRKTETIVGIVLSGDRTYNTQASQVQSTCALKIANKQLVYMFDRLVTFDCNYTCWKL